MRSPEVLLVDPPSTVTVPPTDPVFVPLMLIPFGLNKIGSMDESAIVVEPELIAKLMLAGPPAASALVIAARSDPGPESALVVT